MTDITTCGFCGADAVVVEVLGAKAELCDDCGRWTWHDTIGARDPVPNR